MAPVRTFRSFTRVFTPKNRFFHRPRMPLCRAEGTRRCGGETSGVRRRPQPTRDPAAPGQGHGAHGRAPLLPPLAPSSLGLCPRPTPRRRRPPPSQAPAPRRRGLPRRAKAAPGAFTRRRTRPPRRPQPRGRAGRHLQAALPAPGAFPQLRSPCLPPAPEPPAPCPRRPAEPCPAASPPLPHSAAARSPRAPAAAPPPHLLELVVGGPGRHPQNVVELRVGHVRHGGSGRRAQAGTGRGAARARPGAGLKPPRRHTQTPGVTTPRRGRSPPAPFALRRRGPAPSAHFGRLTQFQHGAAGGARGGGGRPGGGRPGGSRRRPYPPRARGGKGL